MDNLRRSYRPATERRTDGTRHFTLHFIDSIDRPDRGKIIHRACVVTGRVDPAAHTKILEYFPATSSLPFPHHEPRHHP